MPETNEVEVLELVRFVGQLLELPVHGDGSVDVKHQDYDRYKDDQYVQKVPDALEVRKLNN